MKDSKFGAGHEIGGALNQLPAEQKNISEAGMRPSDSAGVKDGLSMVEGFAAEEGGMMISEGRNPETGNPISRVTSNPSSVSASKNGKSFDIC